MVTRENPAAAIEPKHRKEDLVFLVWPDNTCYIHSQREVPKGVTLDLQAGIWMFKGRSFRIGERSHFSTDWAGAALGCYDFTNPKHLQAFQATIEWVAGKRSGPGSFDD